MLGLLLYAVQELVARAGLALVLTTQQVYAQQSDACTVVVFSGVVKLRR